MLDFEKVNSFAGVLYASGVRPNPINELISEQGLSLDDTFCLRDILNYLRMADDFDRLHDRLRAHFDCGIRYQKSIWFAILSNREDTDYSVGAPTPLSACVQAIRLGCPAKVVAVIDKSGGEPVCLAVIDINAEK